MKFVTLFVEKNSEFGGKERSVKLIPTTEELGTWGDCLDFMLRLLTSRNEFADVTVIYDSDNNPTKYIVSDYISDTILYTVFWDGIASVQRDSEFSAMTLTAHIETFL